MKIAVFGLGYVGTVSAAGLAKLGMHVVGVDVNHEKVAALSAGESPVHEPGLAELVGEVVQQGLLRTTTDSATAVLESDVSLICVGTPSRSNGSLNTDYVFRVAEGIGTTLRNKAERHVIVIRSTVLPGTSEAVADEVARVSGKRLSEGFGICMNPEFLREGSALEDFFEAPHTIIGQSDSVSGDVAAEMYEAISAPIIHTDLPTAETLKYANNAFHALKIAFANEIGTICNRFSINGEQMMNLLCSDTRLNISRAYLRPGFAFGGSCLPKDLRALNYLATHNDLATPLLSAILSSNEMHLERAIEMVQDVGNRDVGVLGLTFKADTDDLRESPMVRVVETLIGKGYDVRIYDPNLLESQLIGSNQMFITERIPHLSRLLVEDGRDVLRSPATIIVGTSDAEFHDLLARTNEHHVVCDFVNAFSSITGSASQYLSLA